MSGIVGIVNTDGAAVDRELLSEMTESLLFRGPDAQRLWIDENVGFGHTLFATTDDAWRERQPCTLDGETWIVADARVDGRKDLVDRLSSRGRTALNDANDAELLLHAYLAWGEACVDHLLGDFAFAIWDRRASTLFCARDHFGAKPFFYADCGTSLIFSNTFTCVRRHPAVSDAVDDRTIGDFLLFKYNMRPEATGFSDIRRLPPGHILSWSRDTALRVRKYWGLSLPAEIRYRKSSEYVDHFRDLFESAVRDRLRTGAVAVSMAGGLDSTSIADASKQVFTAQGATFKLHAHTVVFDTLIPDDERKYASLAAERIGIPIHFLVADGFPAYEQRGFADYALLPEPTDARFLALGRNFGSAIAKESRVVLSGDDADCLLREFTHQHFAALARARRFGTLASAMIDYSLWLRRYPPIGLRAMLAGWRNAGATKLPDLPGWLNPDFVARLDLRARWHEVHQEMQREQRTKRPRATSTISRMWWRMFENADATSTRRPLECRWPFADRRVVDFLLAIPVVPWCTNKTLLREAGRGRLPESIRVRKKTPLAGDPVIETLRHPQTQWIDTFQAMPELDRYVTRHAVPPSTGPSASIECYVNLRPLMLNWWLEKRAGQSAHSRRSINDVKGEKGGKQFEVESAV